MSTKEIPIKITQDVEIPGTNPIVLLGPNGAGKTRQAVQIASWNKANMIAALRDIALPPDVVMRSFQQASRELESHLNRRRSHPWELSNEISELFSKLMAEDSAAAIRFRDDYSSGKNSTPEETKLMRLQNAWSTLFPGRRIDFTGYHPKVRSDYSTAGGEYPAQQMSDGERVALYLAGRVLDSTSNIIIVDEPEVHFHSRLATRFWNEMERLRDDNRFVYITHDLPFALSRRDAAFAILMPNTPPHVVSLTTGLPKALAESLLAAASFSIHAKRIVFCEGVEGPSIDQALYSAWFIGPETAVIPVETGENVLRCTTAYSQSGLVAGVDAIGIIDRDYWPDAFLRSLPKGLHALEVHEVENLFCLPEVFVAVAEHLGSTSQDPLSRYDAFLSNARSKFTGGLYNKQHSERFRRRCEHEYQQALNQIPIGDDASQMLASHTTALDSSRWQNTPAAILADEKARLDNALASDALEFNKIFPGKVVLGTAATSLGLTNSAYVEIVCSALKAKEGDSLRYLGRKLESALGSLLPKREI